ncbi:MAG TPA: FHA domain-containing protein [Gemmataceae bacterium]|nr:FHA domain-containing protein [Gemmataceae bacterium]
MNVKLLVVHGRPQGKSFLFPPGEFLFGRGSECHIQPNSDWVSRQHCLLRVGPEAVSVRDLGSRNGTLVNGERVVDERPLHHGDQLQVGPLVFEIRLDEVPAASRPSHPDISSAMTPTVPNIDCRDTSEQPSAQQTQESEPRAETLDPSDVEAPSA